MNNLPDIEIPVGATFIYGNVKLKCVKGSACRTKCYLHKATKDDYMEIEKIYGIFGAERYKANINMQCGGKDEDGYCIGRILPFICDAETREDNTDVIYIKIN